MFCCGGLTPTTPSASTRLEPNNSVCSGTLLSPLPPPIGMAPATAVLTSVLVAMRDLYMKTGHGFILVFSITSRTSLHELAVLRSEINRIKDEENVPMVIVGNKADLEEQRAVARTKAFAISQKWGAPYYEASARTRSRQSLEHVTATALTLWQPTWTRCLSISADRCSVATTPRSILPTMVHTTNTTATNHRDEGRQNEKKATPDVSSCDDVS